MGGEEGMISVWGRGGTEGEDRERVVVEGEREEVWRGESVGRGRRGEREEVE